MPDIDGPKLVTLVHNEQFMPRDFQVLSVIQLPALRRLVLEMGTPSYAIGTREDYYLVDVFSNPGLSGVRHLEISCCRFLDELLPALDRSPMLSQLERLDIVGFAAEPEVLARFRESLPALTINYQTVLTPTAT